jgi:hypothetical protein
MSMIGSCDAFSSSTRATPLRQRFDLSGRLFGGFWQGLQRERRSGIRIDGEPVATLDYSSMFARLAYASKGVRPPAGDLYAIPGLEGRRDAVKLGSTRFCSISKRDGSGRKPKCRRSGCHLVGRWAGSGRRWLSTIRSSTTASGEA